MIMGIRVLHEDFRSLGYCNRGCRQLCAEHGVSWADLLQNGIDESVLLELNDAMAYAAVEVARKRVQNG